MVDRTAQGSQGVAPAGVAQAVRPAGTPAATHQSATLPGTVNVDPLAESGQPSPEERPAAERLRTATTNHCLLRLLERVATRFNEAGIPLMALKGAALNLTIYERPDRRPMADLDLLIRPEDVDAAVALLEASGCRRGRPLVRKDFFPRYHYEVDFIAGRVIPLRIDLHVRPLRPMRYAQSVPPDAFWEEAETVQVGGARVLIPSVENMLIHLAAHSAVHGNPRRMWLRDIRDWAVVWRRQLDWDRVIARAQAWGLALPLGQALERAETTFGEFCPPAVRAQLRRARVGWRDRLALRQAPRDADHPVAHVLVDAICTGNFRLIAGYLRAVLLPDSRHMGEWYCDRHRGWLITAHLMRWTAPLLRQIPRLWGRLRGVEVREHPNGAVGVFMLREVSAGERILRHGASPGGSAHEASPAPTLPQVAERGMPQGAQRYLRHCCRPNAEWCETGLRALKSLSAGTELTVDYGVNACACRKSPPQAPPAARCA